MDPENQNFGKMNNTPEDIIILQMRTINDSHMMYGSWGIKCNKQNFLSFWTIFCPVTHLKIWKIKILKNWNVFSGDNIIILHMSTINENHMMYNSWDMKRDRQNFLSFWTFFCLFTPLTTQKNKILKKWKNCLDILSFYTCVS